jgi:signal transduction histidine kinase/FixJ family two-component response regulator
MTSPHPTTRSKSVLRWYHGFYLLVGLNLFTLVTMLVVSHFTLMMYSDSVHREQEWSSRIGRIYRLAKLSTTVNTPGNDIFRSHDVATERLNLDLAFSRFQEAAKQVQSDVQQAVESEHSAVMMQKLNDLAQTVEKVAVSGHEVLTLFSSGEKSQAASRMAVMDSYHSAATEQVAEVCEDLQRIRDQLLMADVACANVLRRIETGVAVVVLTLIISIACLGHRLRKITERQENILHCKTVDLECAHEFLQENHRNLKKYTDALQEKTHSLEEAQLKAEQASLAKSQFLASMSHEIRTPLTAIIGYSEELAVGGKNEFDPKTIESIHRNGTHLLGIINDILDLSKIEAGRLEVEHIATPLTAVISEIAEMMDAQATTKGLQFEIVARNPIPTQIFTDPMRLRQILLNLIGNAIKFTTHGSIKLECEKLSDNSGRSLLKFSVTDTGIGMNDEEQSRLFQCFTQADQTMSRRFGGSGLGLVISKRLVNMLGGDISVTSQKGIGSTFSFTFWSGMIDDVPHTTTLRAVSSKSNVVPTSSPPIQFQARILLAEDGIDNQRLINAILKKAGCEVTIVENGQQTLDAIREATARGEKYDVILSDMMMPVMDGYTSVTRLRQDGYTGPIIALTAHAMEGERERCLAAGCDDFATKPINRQVFLETIRYHVQSALPLKASNSHEEALCTALSSS